jgi:uncharacterized protein YcfJ
MNRFAAVGLTFGLALALPAMAQNSGSYDNYDDADYAWARVVDVEPIVERFDVPVNRDVCYDEPYEYYEPRYEYVDGRHRDTSGATVLGAIIGGALGNTVGRGDGRRAATVAGALIGGSIAHSNARRRGAYYESGAYVHRGSREVCDTRVDYRRDERVIGYDVTYRYNGRNYHTRTDEHPGDRIRVAVNVAPVY